MIKTLLLVGAGGFLGSVGRYLISQYMSKPEAGLFPTGTFIVNIVGCLIIGLLIGFSINSSQNSNLQLFLGVGFCGGFTTFSSYSLEAFQLFDKGEAGLSLIYMFGSILAGLACVWIGYWITHSFFN